MAPWPHTHIHTERESTLTAIHTCHRPRIPGGHVLIEHRCAIKHCKKREGCNKEKKDQTPPHTNNNKKVPFQTTKKRKKRTKRVRILIRRTSIIYTTTEGAVAIEREREYTYCVPYLSPQKHPNHRSHRTDGQ